MNIVMYFDIDGVVRDLVGAIDRMYRDWFSGHHPVLSSSYDLELRYPLMEGQAREIIFNQQVNRVFDYDAEPYPGVIDGLMWLRGQGEIEVQFLSRQRGDRVQATDSWLARHRLLGFECNYLTSPMGNNGTHDVKKGEFIRDLEDPRLAVLLDDSPEEIGSAESFGVIPVLVERSWNREFRQGWEGLHIRVINKRTLGELLEVVGNLELKNGQ